MLNAFQLALQYGLKFIVHNQSVFGFGFITGRGITGLGGLTTPDVSFPGDFTSADLSAEAGVTPACVSGSLPEVTDSLKGVAAAVIVTSEFGGIGLTAATAGMGSAPSLLDAIGVDAEDSSGAGADGATVGFGIGRGILTAGLATPGTAGLAIAGLGTASLAIAGLATAGASVAGLSLSDAAAVDLGTSGN